MVVAPSWQLVLVRRSVPHLQPDDIEETNSSVGDLLDALDEPEQ